MKSKIQKYNSLPKNLKLKLLENDKRFADLELSVGKLEDKFGEVWELIPDIKERSERIEDLLNIINLGLVDYKDQANKLSAKVSELEKLPSKIDMQSKEYAEKLRELNKQLTEFSAKVQALGTVKDDISKTVREDILPDINLLKESIEKNEVNVEQMRNEVKNLK